MSRTYKLHLSDDSYDRLEQQRADDDGMALPVQDNPTVSLGSAYERGRKSAFRDLDNTEHNPFRRRTRLHEAWDNGRGDELESFA